MFVISVRSSAIKAGAVGILLVGCAALGLFAAGKGISANVSASDSGVSYLAADAQQRISFLSQFGWEVEEDPVEVSEVIIPAEFDGAYEKYNEIQKEHGLDLADYSGRRAKRWTYEVKNYPGYEDTDGLVQANIFVYDGRVIGGDICSLETDGFIQSFNFPEEKASKENKTTDVETTSGQNNSVTGGVQPQSGT